MLSTSMNLRDVSGTDEFETEEKESHKQNERLHGVVEGKRNGEGEGEGRGEEGIDADEGQPNGGFCSQKMSRSVTEY